MKDFAQINEENIIQRIIVVESAQKANELLGGNWVEVGKPNKNIPSRGWTYDPEYDNFYAPRPYENWFLDENLRWKPKPTDENITIIPEYIKPKIIVDQNDLIYKWDNDLCKWINI